MATSGFRLIDYAGFKCDLDHTVGGKMRDTTLKGWSTIIWVGRAYIGDSRPKTDLRLVPSPYWSAHDVGTIVARQRASGNGAGRRWRPGHDDRAAGCGQKPAGRSASAARPQELA